MSALFHAPGFTLVCVDPGLRGCGVAVFAGGELLKAAYVENPIESGRGYAAHARMGEAVYNKVPMEVRKTIIEHPRIYPGSDKKSHSIDPNDLLDVVAVGAAVASHFPAVETLFPADWKGQVPKEVMTERIRRSLTEEERGRIEKCKASLMHNVLDACGIGLYRLGRLNKKVYHND